MKSSGIVRRIDELGRIVVPKEYCRTLYINNGDPLEFTVEGETIMIRKYYPVCALCGAVGELEEYKTKLICHSCIKEIKSTL